MSTRQRYDHKSTVLLVLLLLSFLPAGAKGKVRVACIGNSITYGLTLDDPATQSYPAQLQRLLGTRYEVGNFGRSGATLLRRGHRPYMAQPEYAAALAFRPDVALIHLGVNDTDPRDWPDYRDDFVRDYLALIDSVRSVSPRCRVLVARLTPITYRHARFESGTRDWECEIQEAIETVARRSGAQIVDFHAPLYAYPSLLPDAVHPMQEGAALLARAAYAAITGDYGGLQMSAVYGDGMVLQRDVPLRIHGVADAGERVTVAIGGQSLTAVTGLDGRWSVTLAPLRTGPACRLTVSTGKRKIVCDDVLVGEVWLCSGQSNMELSLQTSGADLSHVADSALRVYDMRARWRTDAREWDAAVLDSVDRLQYFAPACWRRASPEVLKRFSAVAYHFGRMLRDSLRVPVGLVCNAVGGSPTEAWVDRATVERDFPAILRDWMHNDFIQPWVRGRAALNVRRAAVAAPRHPYEPCYLFEAGIMPLDTFALRGVIWYQGESNAHNKDAHARLFRMLVGSWRDYWRNGAMPFYYVQLSSLSRPSWPWFRDSQRLLAASVPHVGMAVSSDVGDSLDVHPRDKRTVGERLARWALHDTYHFDHVVPSGPLAREATADGAAVRVTFDYGDGLHSADGLPLRTFEIAEDEGLYEPATVEVTAGGLRLSRPDMSHPRYVRYGWQPYTRANLVNAAGLPASTFRLEVLRREGMDPTSTP